MGNIYRSDLDQGILMHDCISFDLMDTLIMRRVPSPADVFAIVEQRVSHELSIPFAEYRIRAEKEWTSRGLAPTFENIYSIFAQLARLNEMEMRLLMDEEWKTEQEVLVVRRDMVDVLRTVHESGKTATILADSPWSGIQIRDLLRQMGVQVYTMILSAADVGQNRASGLYAHYRAICGEDKRFMHIGDNAVKDGELARANGIDSLVIPRALDQYKRDNPGLQIPQDLSSRRILGEKIARQYNSPFA